MDLLILTGHSSGLGAALLQSGLDRGWTVLGLARRRTGRSHPRLIEASLDLSRTDSWETVLNGLYRQLTGGWGRVILINNAGCMGPTGPLQDLAMAEVSESFQLNAIAPIRLMRWALQTFPTLPLRIGNIVSGAATKPYSGWTIYCSTKASLRMSSMVLAQEMERQRRDVRILCYSPGVLDTAMQASLRDLSPQAFPEIVRFRKLHADGQLVAPQASAEQLLALLERSDGPPFLEYRYGDSERS